MKFINNMLTILSALVVLNKSCNAENVFHDGIHCDLKSKVTCHINAKNGAECSTRTAFDVSQCGSADLSFTAVYTLVYKNNNPSGNDIRFSTEINPESENTPLNPFSFGRANLHDASIEVDRVLRAGVTKTFEERRVIDPCGTPGEVPTNRFVSELQLNGHVIGKEGDLNYSCSSRDFYTHDFAHFSPPTPSPTPLRVQVIHVPVVTVPVAANPVTPEGKGKGKGTKQGTGKGKRE